MSLAVIATPDPLATDWSNLTTIVEYTRKGKHGIGLTNFTTGSVPQVASGSWAEVAGPLFRASTDESISGSATAGLINYVTLIPGGSGASAYVTPTWSTTAPTWSDSYQGWYSGTTRYVASCFYTGSEYIEKSIIECRRTRELDLWPGRRPQGRDRTVGFALDFYQEEAGAFYTLTGGSFNSGTIAELAGTAHHPGIARINSGGSSNGGYRINTAVDALVMTGWEMFECIFRIPTTTSTVIRLGFHDSLTTTAPTDGVFVYCSGTTLDGRTYDNSSSSTTSSTYTITGNTWYRALIAVNTDASRVDFFLYTDDGSLVWNDNLTANIPDARDVGVFAQAWNGDATARNVLDVDRMEFWCPRGLTR